MKKMVIHWNFQKGLFLEIPIFLLGLNYILYNALEIDYLKTPLRVVAVLLIIIGWIVQREYYFDRLQWIAIITSLSGFVLHGFGAINYIVAIAFAVCIKQDIKQLIKSAYMINLALIVLMIFLLFFHLVDNHGYISTMGRQRWTLGFENPNVAALFYSSAIYLYILSREKVKIYQIAISGIASCVIFYYTNSRTSLISILIFCFVNLIINIESNEQSKKNIDVVCVLCVDILFIMNLLSVFMANKLATLDALLSYRISSFIQMINKAGIKGFLIGGTTQSVDNFYYMLLFEYGVFIYLFFAAITHIVMKEMIADRENRYIAFLLAMFLVATMESSIIRPEILVSLIVWKIVISYRSPAIGGNEKFENEKKIYRAK